MLKVLIFGMLFLFSCQAKRDSKVAGTKLSVTKKQGEQNTEIRLDSQEHDSALAKLQEYADRRVESDINPFEICGIENSDLQVTAWVDVDPYAIQRGGSLIATGRYGYNCPESPEETLLEECTLSFDSLKWVVDACQEQ
jgi:hypothetical protein